MRKIFFAFLLLCFAGSAFAQNNYFTYKTVTDSPNYFFPVLKMNTDSVAENKINLVMQLSELDVTIENSDTTFFRRLLADEKSVLYSTDFLGFAVLTNTPTIFSVAFVSEWTGAASENWVNFYNFNAGNGDRIALTDLFDTSKLDEARAYFSARRKKHFETELRNVPSDYQFSTEFIEKEMSESFSDNFFFSNDSVFVNDDKLLTKSEKYYITDMLTAYSADELETFLSDFGRCFFFPGKTGAAHFRLPDNNQLFRGTTAEGVPFYMLIQLHNGSRCDGIYMNTKEGIVHHFKGDFEAGILDTQEIDSTGAAVFYYSIIMESGKLQAIVSNANSTESFILNATRW